jgi:hypothetical protein
MMKKDDKVGIPIASAPELGCGEEANLRREVFY